MSKLIKIFRTNYTAFLLLISGLTIDAVYLALFLFTDPTPYADLPTFVKVALALPIFSGILYCLDNICKIITGQDEIVKLIAEDSHHVSIHSILKAFLIGFICIVAMITSIIFNNEFKEYIAEARCKQNNTHSFCKQFEKQPTEDSHDKN